VGTEDEGRVIDNFRDRERISVTGNQPEICGKVFTRSQDKGEGKKISGNREREEGEETYGSLPRKVREFWRQVNEQPRAPSIRIPDQRQREVPITKVQKRPRSATGNSGQLTEKEELDPEPATRDSLLRIREKSR
jgi:hypothetical protein